MLESDHLGGLVGQTVTIFLRDPMAGSKSLVGRLVYWRRGDETLGVSTVTGDGEVLVAIWKNNVAAVIPHELKETGRG